jgi:beta-mannosidase
MQAEGLRYAIESNRRRKWHCSGTSPWQLNEAFPNTACTNAVDYLGLPKPAYWWVRRAYEPVHISAHYERIACQPGDAWRAEIWVNTSHGVIQGCRWTAELLGLSGLSLIRTEGSVDLADNAAKYAGDVNCLLPAEPGLWLLLISLFDAGGDVVSRNEYVFSTAQPALQPLLQAPETTLNVWHRRGEVRVRNTGAAPALFVQVEPVNGQWLLPQDDYFCLAPGEVRNLRLEGQGNVTLRAWNTDIHRIRLS